MAIRGVRCARCLLKTALCVCTYVPRVPTRTRVVILRHALERWRPSNTGRHAALALPNSVLLEYGGLDDVLPDEELGGPGTWLLFPGGRASAPPDPPRRLVVLDASWSQARRMSQRLPILQELPRLSLPTPATAPARFRRGREPEQRATLEAIAAALVLLEGAPVGAPLARLFDEVVRRSQLGV